jgi:flavin-dependent dehydrogenase
MSHEAVVIGAGPAGSMAARELARRGIDVLLIEKKNMPRSKACGACLNRRAVSWIELAGLSPLLRRLGAVRTERFRACCGGRSVEVRLPGGAAVSRDAFDHALAQAAVAAGAKLLAGATATVCATEPGAPERRIELRDAAGQTHTIGSKIVLVADGLGHPALARCHEFVSRVSRNTKVGVRATFSDRCDRVRPGVIYMAIGQGGYAGLVRLEDGSLNLAAALDCTFLKTAGSPAAAVESILKPTDLQRLDLTSAVWQGTLPLTRQTARPVGHRLFVLGDAAGYVEPFTGEGMAWALAGGLAVATPAERGLLAWNQQVERDWLRVYRSLVRGRQFWCRAFAAVLRKPSLAGAAIRLAGVWPACCRPIVAHLNRPARPRELCRS